MSLAPERLAIGLNRLFTTPGHHPFEQVAWERRDARISNWKDGTVAFEQRDVEFPVGWSLNATNIVAQKYFRGTLGTAERETSLKQVIDRVADTITAWGTDGGYFVDEAEAETFRNELKYILVTQRAAFNSPVWFNIGVKGVPSAGERLLHLVGRRHDGLDPELVPGRGRDLQGRLRGGRQPVPKIRSSKELLAGRRHRLGPRQLHARRRRLGRHHQVGWQDPPRRQDGHPQRRPPRRRGVHLVQGRVRSARPACCVTPASTWTSTAPIRSRSSTRTPTTRCGSPTSSWRPSSTTPTGHLKAVTRRDQDRAGPRPVAPDRQASWECADPGLQFDTTINKWHTAHNTGSHQRLEPVQRVHAPRQLGVQPGLDQPAEVPSTTRGQLRRRRVTAHRRPCHVHRPGDPRRSRRLPDRADRRDQPQVPPARPSATPTSARC